VTDVSEEEEVEVLPQGPEQPTNALFSKGPDAELESVEVRSPCLVCLSWFKGQAHDAGVCCPQLDPDHRLLLRSSLPLLKSRNCGVVLAVCTLHYYCGSQTDATAAQLGGHSSTPKGFS
jgi:hypothetical protein